MIFDRRKAVFIGTPPIELIIFAIMVIVFIVLAKILISPSMIKRKIKEGIKENGLDFLKKGLEDESLREEAIEELSKSEDPHACEILISFFNSKEFSQNEDGYLKALILNAIAETNEPKGIEFLLSLLEENQDLYIKSYISYLFSVLAEKGIKEERAIEPMFTLLEEIIKMKERKDPDYNSTYHRWVENGLKCLMDLEFEGRSPQFMISLMKNDNDSFKRF